MGDGTELVKVAPKGMPKPNNVVAKTTVNTKLPLAIHSKQFEYIVVLTKSGDARPSYPILGFDIAGPAGWFFDVQVSSGNFAGFIQGPGIKSSWFEKENPIYRLHHADFSSWTNGDQTLHLDGSGRGSYNMPLEWWKDQARRPLKEFVDENYYYRVVAFKDASGTGPRFSTPTGKTPRSVTVHNNLVSFMQTTSGDYDDRYGVNATAEKPVSMQIEVREPNTWDMYCMVQWIMGDGRLRTRDGNIEGIKIHRYGFLTRKEADEFAIDRYGDSDPRSRNNKPDSHTDTTAVFKDAPGVSSLGTDIMAYIYRSNFEDNVHLNCDVMGKTVKIKTVVGSLPVFDKLIGVLPDPQPAILAKLLWRARILLKRYPTGLVITHPDDELDDFMWIDPIAADQE
jgi:hypothetical protein